MLTKFNKVNYVSRKTIIGAENLNNIQDRVLDNAEKVENLNTEVESINSRLEQNTNRVESVESRIESELHSHSNKTVLDNITSAKVTEWNNKSTFDGNYNSLTNKPTIPTKTSQLTNDSGYLTSIPSEYVTDNELNAKGYLTEHQDISHLATKEELFSKDYNDLTNKPTIPSIDGLATKIYVNEEIKKIDVTSQLGDYAKKSDIPVVPTNISAFINDKGYITEIPSEYITEAELNAKGYLTQHQDISGKADKTELHSHNNKTVLDGITNDKVTEWNNKSTFDGNYNSLTNKPIIPTVTNDLTNTLKTNYDKAYTHSQEAHAPSNAQKNSDITKIEIEAKLTGNITSHTHSQYLTEHQDLSSYATKSELPTKTSQLTNDSGYLTSIPSEYVTDSELEGKDYATKEYVNNTINSIDYDSTLSFDTYEIVFDDVDGNVIGYVDSNNNIVLYGSLSGGAYSIQYELEDGSLVTVGTLNIDGNGGTDEPIEPDTPTITNLIPLSVDENGDEFVGTNNEDGYMSGYRINSSGNVVAFTESGGTCITGFIPVSLYDTIRIANFTPYYDENRGVDKLTFYNSSKTYVGYATLLETNVNMTIENGVYSTKPSTAVTEVAFFRICTGTINEDTIATVNQEIPNKG